MFTSLDKLRKERSMKCSGLLLNEDDIPVIREKDYIVDNRPLDGDAPKQFIRLYTYHPDSGIHRRNTKTWIPYIAKTAEKWYPHESVIEYMINCIGVQLGLEMNEVALYKINGQIRFLSRFFLKNNEALVHGAEISGEYLEDMTFAEEIANDRATSRELFTFQFIEKAMAAKFGSHCNNLIRELVKMITFDAIAGNNDRHFYNWGVITNIKKISEVPRFAPFYDSARGFLWNRRDDFMVNNLRAMNSGGKKIEHYIENACPRISIDGNSEINHFGLISYLKNYKDEFRVIIADMASVDNEKKVIEMLRKNFFGFFISERCELIEYIVQQRFKKVRGI
ncbi:HipA domain-containing protein [Pedobacter endophyticus]|uniref:HipA domain-containing protein n=1 Tax=Pedobacter endophyticus TaxID=2789740 RepID=A0A7S9L1R1_9SPHI|nr:HipA domain-containing protein [Pedobacter endophyticus]QPH40511.1 HipA domain-containing protein [Pedobacter endophyticus]